MVAFSLLHQMGDAGGGKQHWAGSMPPGQPPGPDPGPPLPRPGPDPGPPLPQPPRPPEEPQPIAQSRRFLPNRDSPHPKPQ